MKHGRRHCELRGVGDFPFAMQSNAYRETIFSPVADVGVEVGMGVGEFLSHAVEEEVQKRLKHAMALKDYDETDVDAARESVEAMLEVILYSHHLYENIKGMSAHGAAEAGGHHMG